MTGEARKERRRIKELVKAVWPDDTAIAIRRVQIVLTQLDMLSRDRGSIKTI